MSEAAATNARQLSNSLQSTLVRAYRGFGLAALLAILIGLLSFLLVNAFYLFDNSWIRPVILTPSHERVVETNSRIAAEMHNQEQARSAKTELELELTSMDARIAEHERFASDFEALASQTKRSSIEAMMARRELELSRLEAERAKARKATIGSQMKALSASADEFENVIEKLKMSPYYRATDGQVTVAFVPYANLDNVSKGDPVYGCKWGLIRCKKVGRVGETLEGEVSDTHPNSGTALRGTMVELDLKSEWAAKQSALFVGSKPFWLF